MTLRAVMVLAQKTLLCTVCYDLLRDPVAFPCGHVFCRACSVRFLSVRPQCPLCNQPVPHKRASIPLPAIAALTELVRSAVHALRPPGPEPLALDTPTPRVSRACSASRTQLLRTPPPEPPAVGPAAPHGARTPHVEPTAGPTTGPTAGPTAGLCVLCHLDITDRALMRPFVRRLLDADPTCDRDRVRQLNEEDLAECVGPARPFPSGAKRGREGCAPRVVHRSCLEWGLLRQATAATAAAALTRAEAAALRDAREALCAFCGQEGRCLVPCAGCGRKAFHYPCARLTGPGVCVLTGERAGTLLCAACAGQR